ncbi:39S ribosomal protein L39, mitochondrial [Strongyloides ratti]|uniref:39S ribosomal protein L39, mitochondrial n=1 Tax=Strongyloides ratti TaxID=34506 RepID=A0A090LPZ5_STRRB|nr:39S ribosomal protein L39, mitochondrial [Strongyloides ratti]CEF70204.1 39S ribosomal protein L39, mitochondrial [Strongyloides ratti]
MKLASSFKISLANLRNQSSSRTITNETLSKRLNLYKTIKNTLEAEKKKDITKILVNVTLPDAEPVKVLMNKDLSTPYDCAKHVNRQFAINSALCLLSTSSDNSNVVSMHTPLTEDKCTLTFLPFSSQQYATEINHAFWRSATLILSAVIEKSFKTQVTLHPFLHRSLSEGYFESVAKIHALYDWVPTNDELNLLTKAAYNDIILKEYNFENIYVKSDMARELFSDNIERLGIIDQLEKELENVNNIGIVRVGDYIDLSPGLTISNTSQIGRFQITNVVCGKISNHYSFRGLALPKDQTCSAYSWDLLVERSKRLVAPE